MTVSEHRVGYQLELENKPTNSPVAATKSTKSSATRNYVKTRRRQRHTILPAATRNVREAVLVIVESPSTAVLLAAALEERKDRVRNLHDEISFVVVVYVVCAECEWDVCFVVVLGFDRVVSVSIQPCNTARRISAWH